MASIAYSIAFGNIAISIIIKLSGFKPDRAWQVIKNCREILLTEIIPNVIKD